MSRDDHECSPEAERAQDSVKNQVRKEKNVVSLEDYPHAFGGAFQVPVCLAMLSRHESVGSHGCQSLGSQETGLGRLGGELSESRSINCDRKKTGLS